MSLRRCVIVSAIVCLLTAALAAQPTVDDDTDPKWRALKWREVGPYRGGRCAAVAGIPQDRDTYYMGATGGGVWKTTDGGRAWRNVSDGTFGGSIGAVAVSAWDPNVVYVGGGEKTVRGNVSHGDGMWKSTDAGRSWKHVGLDDTRHIARIRVHPKDPDTVWVAAMGHLFGPNDERGVYRSRDGGQSWSRVLFVNSQAGCVDLALDPTNPRILYASFWRVIRRPWSLESGGEGSTMWKSTDGGDSWTEITNAKGLPDGVRGISGISVSRANPDTVYAIVEAKDGGVFRSRDAGKTWTRVNSERKLRQRAWYYSRIYADPVDVDTVYVLNVRFHRSKDGGKTFAQIATPHSDNHDLWIDPNDPRRMIESNDGGANVSTDGGKTWSPQDNQPTAQFYRVSCDDAFPYRLLGGQQDNSPVRIRSRSLVSSGIGPRDWSPTAGGESGHIVAKPGEAHVVYGGNYLGTLNRLDHRTGERRAVDVWPDFSLGWGTEHLRYRFQWNFPIFFSPHDANTLYAAANVLFKSTDAGASWQPISGDLTRNDKTKQASSGGPITKDNTGVEYYCTIFAAAESPHEAGVIWCGTDDGRVHVTRDDGAEWTDVTPDWPEWMQVNSIDVHPFEKGGLYVAATRYRLDDFTPYVLRTTDWGATWTTIVSGIAPDHFTRVVRADPARRGLLYAGTERGVYVSHDDGASWEPFQQNLPIVPITDLQVKNGDLVAATQGRGFWILDDLTPLHSWIAATAEKPAYLFAPRPTLRIATGRDANAARRNRGTNPHTGVVFRYHLREKPADDVAITLTIDGPDGEPIQTWSRTPAKKPAREDGARRGPNLRVLPAEAGLNQWVWNLRYPAPRGFPKMVLWAGSLVGPRAVPGAYRATLRVGDATETVAFVIQADPRSSATPQAMQEQFAFCRSLGDTIDRAHRAIEAVRAVRPKLAALRGRAEKAEATALADAIRDFETRAREAEEALYQTKNRSRQDPLNFPIRLNDKLATLMRKAMAGDAAPTAQMRDVAAALTAKADEAISTIDGLWRDALPPINALAAAADLAKIVPPETSRP